MGVKGFKGFAGKRVKDWILKFFVFQWDDVCFLRNEKAERFD